MNHESPVYINTAETKRLLSVTAGTLRKWASQDKIRIIRTPSKHRLYNREDIYNLLGRDTDTPQKKSYIYARVSSKKQMDDLERQTDFLKSKFPHHILVTDIASGINWKRKGFKTILEQTMLGNVTEVVVAHKDRLCRFAFDLVKTIFEFTNTKLIVLNENKDKSTEQELAEDLLSIVHIYTCRNMGKRRYSYNKIENLPITNTENSTATVDGDDTVCL